MIQLKIITVEFNKKDKIFNSEILEKFTRNKNIKEYKANLIKIENEYFWTIFISYEEFLGIKIEDKNIKNFSEAEEILLEKLKVWRSEMGG